MKKIESQWSSADLHVHACLFQPLLLFELLYPLAPGPVAQSVTSLTTDLKILGLISHLEKCCKVNLFFSVYANRYNFSSSGFSSNKYIEILILINTLEILQFSNQILFFFKKTREQIN
jgi:hypothetical protein